MGGSRHLLIVFSALRLSPYWIPFRITDERILCQMPPQGESTGLCIEDTIIFARHMMHYHHRRPDNNPPPPPSASAPPSLQTIFNTYTACRRSRINACFDEAKWRWETVRDSGWLMHKVKMWAMPWFLWWSEEKRQKDFGEDFWDMEVEF